MEKSNVLICTGLWRAHINGWGVARPIVSKSSVWLSIRDWHVTLKVWSLLCGIFETREETRNCVGAMITDNTQTNISLRKPDESLTVDQKQEVWGL